MTRKNYPSDVSDDEWAFVAPYLTLIREDAPQREHPLREVFNGLRYVVRTGIQWRMMPHDLPPWHAVYHQAQRWLAAGVFEAMVNDLRALLRVATGLEEQPSAAIFDGRTLQPTPESGECAAHDGYKRKKGSKIRPAVDTLGYLLALSVTPANEQERAQAQLLAEEVQEMTQNSVQVAFVDQGHSGEDAEQAAASAGIDLTVTKMADARKGFVLLPRRWVVERSFAWASRFHRLARDFERTPEFLRGLHYVTFAILMIHDFPRSTAHVV